MYDFTDIDFLLIMGTSANHMLLKVHPPGAKHSQCKHPCALAPSLCVPALLNRCFFMFPFFCLLKVNIILSWFG